jgi:flagellum-specific ATP synthase
MDAAHLDDARVILANIANYDASRTLIESGLYVPGASTTLDSAVAAKPEIDRFLMQGQEDFCALTETRTRMRALGGPSF